MQDWKCSVRMPSNHIQTVWVEAYNYSDAVLSAESSTGGKCLNATAQFGSSSASKSNEGAEISGSGLLLLLFLLFILTAWKYMLIIGAIALVIWIVISIIKE
jgi:uncharacterized membrane protein